MSFLLKLVWRDFRRHHSMLTFALLAIIATCGLIVWFVASIDIHSFAEDNGTKDYFGCYTLAICADKALPPQLATAVQTAQSAVKTSPARQIAATMRLDNFEAGLVPSGMGERRSPALLGLTDTASPFPLVAGRWFAAADECVVGTSAEKLLTTVNGTNAETREIAIGDTITITVDNTTRTLTVVGKVSQQEPPKIQSRGATTFQFGFGLGMGGGNIGGPQPQPAAVKQQTPNAAPAAGPGGRGGGPGGRGGGPGGRGGGPGGRGGRGGMFQQNGTVPSPVDASVYVSMDTMRDLAPGEPNILFIQLQDGTHEDDFYKNVESAMGAPFDSLHLRKLDTQPPKPEELLQSGDASKAIISQAWGTIGIVILASIFIIFTTLSMGISEKVRYLAMLRTVGFTRTQVAWLIVLEGFCLGILGWLGGIASGWALLTGLTYMRTGVWPVVSMHANALLFSFLCSAVGSLAASLIPAWRATRISPAEAMPNRLQRFSTRHLIGSGVIGLALLAVIPIIVFGLETEAQNKVKLFTTVGTVCLGAGFLLFLPWTVVLTERVPGPLVARLFGFHPRFLAQALTANQWRSIGTAIAIAIGLGLYTAIHIWSTSMLAMFNVPDTIPDVLVRFQEGVISQEIAENVRHNSLIDAQRFMRVAVAQPNFDAAFAQRINGKPMSNNLVCMGVDAETAWNDDHPMLRLAFTEGSRAEAHKAFSKPDARVCVIPETLAVSANLHIGDTIPLAMTADGKRAREQRRPPNMAPSQDAPEDEIPVTYVPYTVVGVVDFAWVWFSKCSYVRVSAGRTTGLIFTPYHPLLQDFGALDNEFFWFDTKPGTSYNDIFEAMKAIAKAQTQKSMRFKLFSSFAGGTLWDSGINRNFVTVSSNESLNNSLNSRAFGVIDTMTQMPLVILLLSSLAIINTMVVSVRSRRWEMGVMRACGVTRNGLVRMILAESLLIGLCACIVSFCFGLFYAWLASAMVTYAPVFGVTAPPLIIPWGSLLPGYAIAIAVSLGAGIWPAVSAGAQEISALLQRRE